MINPGKWNSYLSPWQVFFLSVSLIHYSLNCGMKGEPVSLRIKNPTIKQKYGLLLLSLSCFCVFQEISFLWEKMD